MLAYQSERKQAGKSRKMLRESILASADLFSAKQFFLNDEFSLVDCSIAPVLWRLPAYGIDLGSRAGNVEHFIDPLNLCQILTRDHRAHGAAARAAR